MYVKTKKDELIDEYNNLNEIGRYYIFSCSGFVKCIFYELIGISWNIKREVEPAIPSLFLCKTACEH